MKQRGIVYEYPKGGTLYSRNYSTEGNKLYRRNGYYYLLHIEFLDGGNGAGTYVYRSRNLYGTKADGSPGTPGDIGTYEIKRIDRTGILIGRYFRDKAAWWILRTGGGTGLHNSIDTARTDALPASYL